MVNQLFDPLFCVKYETKRLSWYVFYGEGQSKR
jgi:hypothetical protein